MKPVLIALALAMSLSAALLLRKTNPPSSSRRYQTRTRLGWSNNSPGSPTMSRASSA